MKCDVRAARTSTLRVAKTRPGRSSGELWLLGCRDLPPWGTVVLRWCSIVTVPSESGQAGLSGHPAATPTVTDRYGPHGILGSMKPDAVSP